MQHSAIIENDTEPTKVYLPKPLAQRLPVYYRLLKELSDQGVERISVTELGTRIGILPAQIRHDFSYVDNFGPQSNTYVVDDLLAAFGKMLGDDQRVKLVLIGSGNLGRALASYEGFRKRGYQFVAVFDEDNALNSRVGVLEVRPISTLNDYLRSHQVNIGVVAVPASAAQEITDVFVNQGVKAIWNFAPVRLLVPSDVVVEHIHLSDSLMSLVFRLHAGQTSQQ